MLTPERADKILDIGAGKGVIVAKVLEVSAGAEICAVDPSEKKIAAMRKGLPSVRCSVAGAERLPFSDSEFDKAYATMSLHHFADKGASLKEIARVLKKGGSFVILEVSPGSRQGWLFRFIGKLMGERVDTITIDGLKALVEKTGMFTVVKSVSLGPRYLIQLTKN